MHLSWPDLQVRRRGERDALGRTPGKRKHRGPPWHEHGRCRTPLGRRSGRIGHPAARFVADWYQSARSHQHHVQRSAGSNDRHDGPSRERPAGEVHFRGTGRYRGHLARDIQTAAPGVCTACARAIRRRHAVGVRRRPFRGWSVLLFCRPKGLPRSLVLPGARSTVRRSWRLRARSPG